MDFMWFWVSVGIAVEVIRQSHQHCYPKKKPHSTAEGFKEPLLQADGKCPHSCCNKEVEAYETDTGADTDESSDEIVSDMSDEIVSSEDLEEYTESLIDKRKGKNVVKDDSMQEIMGRIYPAGPGCPKLVHFKVSENGGAKTLKKETSVKIHPQPNGAAADRANSSVGTSGSKDKPSNEYRVVPPIQEVMSTRHANIPACGEGR